MNIRFKYHIIPPGPRTDKEKKAFEIFKNKYLIPERDVDWDFELKKLIWGKNNSKDG